MLDNSYPMCAGSDCRKPEDTSQLNLLHLPPVIEVCPLLNPLGNGYP